MIMEGFNIFYIGKNSPIPSKDKYEIKLILRVETLSKEWDRKHWNILENQKAQKKKSMYFHWENSHWLWI